MKNNKQRLFEIMEKVNPEMDNTWAIFRISKGYGKCYATSIENDSIHICDYGVKYSDSAVLKFSLEQAKAIVEKNHSFYDTLGIVNNKGIQLKFDIYNKIWQKI
jgi:hypothetical protein